MATVGPVPVLPLPDPRIVPAGRRAGRVRSSVSKRRSSSCRDGDAPDAAAKLPVVGMGSSGQEHMKSARSVGEDDGIGSTLGSRSVMSVGDCGLRSEGSVEGGANGRKAVSSVVDAVSEPRRHRRVPSTMASSENIVSEESSRENIPLVEDGGRGKATQGGRLRRRRLSQPPSEDGPMPLSVRAGSHSQTTSPRSRHDHLPTVNLGKGRNPVRSDPVHTTHSTREHIPSIRARNTRNSSCHPTVSIHPIGDGVVQSRASTSPTLHLARDDDLSEPVLLGDGGSHVNTVPSSVSLLKDSIDDVTDSPQAQGRPIRTLPLPFPPSQISVPSKDHRDGPRLQRKSKSEYNMSNALSVETSVASGDEPGVKRAQLAPSTTRAQALKRANRANRPAAIAPIGDRSNGQAQKSLDVTPKAPHIPDSDKTRLSQLWCEVEMLLRVRIASQADAEVVQRDTQASLLYLDRLAATCARLGCSQGALSRLLLPFDTETSASDQAMSAHIRHTDVDPSSHPLLGQLKEKELGRLKSGATTMRALVRMKVADDMDLVAAKQALVTTSTFFTGIEAVAVKLGLAVFDCIGLLQ